MRSVTLTAIAALSLGMAGAQAASITGTVTGPDGKPFRAAFVQARNADSKITVSVLSGNDGKYHIEDLAGGTYGIQIRAPGYQADAKSDVKLGPNDRTFKAYVLLYHHALPNFYFHTTTAYDILRHYGVELGKRDFMGQMPG